MGFARYTLLLGAWYVLLLLQHNGFPPTLGCEPSPSRRNHSSGVQTSHKNHVFFVTPPFRGSHWIMFGLDFLGEGDDDDGGFFHPLICDGLMVDEVSSW